MLQQVGTIVRSPVSLGTAALGGVLAFAAGVTIAISAPLLLVAASTGHSSITGAWTVRGVARAEQVSHNQSEEGLRLSNPAGAEQVNHDRSEEGFADS